MADSTRREGSARTVAALWVSMGVAALGMAAARAQPAPTRYAVVARNPLGGEGGWDYLSVDAPRHRLYISRSRHVQVVDLERDSLVGDIPDTPGVHGIALVPGLDRGFTSNGRDSSVSVIDLASLRAIRRIHLHAEDPDAIVYDQASGRVFAFNGGSGSASVLDARDGAAVGTISLGGAPEFAVTDGQGRLYVNLEDRSQVVALDTHTLRVLARWSLAPGRNPTGLAIDRARRRLFSVCANGLMVVSDAERGRRIATVPIGRGPDGAAFDPGPALAFSSNGEGTLTVVGQAGADQYRVVQTVRTQRGARTLTLDPETHRLYLVTAAFGPAAPPSAQNPHPRPSIVPGSFVILVVAPTP